VGASARAASARGVEATSMRPCSTQMTQEIPGGYRL